MHIYGQRCISLNLQMSNFKTYISSAFPAWLSDCPSFSPNVQISSTKPINAIIKPPKCCCCQCPHAYLCAKHSTRAKTDPWPCKLLSAGAIPSSQALLVGLLPGHTCGIDYPPWLAAAFLPATHLSARVTEEMAKGFHSWNKLRGRGKGGELKETKKTTTH